ncbi:UNVERIFIED_CONTAM: hypothetical protein NCL1_45931 [Trichonephila clavipes]
MGKDCVRICNEQTTCSEVVSLFSIRQTGCRKPQHDRGSGRPSSSTTEITRARNGEMIQNNRRVTLSEISSELGLSYGSVQHIVSDVLRYSKTVLRNHPPRPGSMDRDLISTKTVHPCEERLQFKEK